MQSARRLSTPPNPYESVHGLAVVIEQYVTSMRLMQMTDQPQEEPSGEAARPRHLLRVAEIAGE